MTGRHWVAGVDGCPRGWLVVLRDEHWQEPPRLRFCASFAEVMVLEERPAVVAVDMPIGLPDRIEGRGRVCEALVRAVLGARQSSVFAIPSRAAVMEEDYRKACDIASATSDPARKVARQAFGLFPKIREIDAVLRGRPDLGCRVCEVHPEAIFRAMNGGRPAELPKKIRSRPNPEGLNERRRLLEAAGFPADFLGTETSLPGRAGADDLLDASACAWTARRILTGEAECYPPDPPRDAYGLEMAIRT